MRLRLRLLIPEFELQPEWTCGCGSKVNVQKDFYHLVSCNKAEREIIRRHDKAVDVLALGTLASTLPRWSSRAVAS